MFEALFLYTFTRQRQCHGHAWNLSLNNLAKPYVLNVLIDCIRYILAVELADSIDLVMLLE